PLYFGVWCSSESLERPSIGQLSIRTIEDSPASLDAKFHRWARISWKERGSFSKWPARWCLLTLSIRVCASIAESLMFPSNRVKLRPDVANFKSPSVPRLFAARLGCRGQP